MRSETQPIILDTLDILEAFSASSQALSVCFASEWRILPFKRRNFVAQFPCLSSIYQHKNEKVSQISIHRSQKIQSIFIAVCACRNTNLQAVVYTCSYNVYQTGGYEPKSRVETQTVSKLDSDSRGDRSLSALSPRSFFGCHCGDQL